MKRKRMIAALLCTALTFTSVTVPVNAKVQNTTVTEPQTTLDMEDFNLNEENGIYDLNKKIHNLTGTVVAGSEQITSLRYELSDEAGTIVKAGYANVKKNGTFKISKMGFLLGQNTLQITVNTADNQYVTTYQIYNEEIKNTDNVEVDERDNDGDGLINYWEDYFGTKKNKADSDGDGLSDYEEIRVLGSDPLHADTDGNGVSDYDEDFDGDGLSNGEEIVLGTDPMLADSDGDGLSDAEELHTYGTDPVNANSDGDGANDGWEVANGYDPLTAQDTFAVTLTSEDGLATLSLEGNGAGVSAAALTITENAFLAGNASLISAVYDVTVADGVTNAVLSVADETENSGLYQFDSESQVLTELEATQADGRISAVTTATGIYVVLSKDAPATEVPGDNQENPELDSNGDGINDYMTKQLCDGTILTSNGEKVFGTASFEEIQGSDDYDNDGLKNGEEVTIQTAEDGTEYAYLVSSPVLADSDNDGITDDKDTAPWERGLENGVIGAIQIYSRHVDDESFVSGHAWLVFTSYVNDEQFVLDEVRMSYQYDESAGTYVDRGTAGTYDLDRGDYMSIGNYRSALLDVVYDSVGSDAPTLLTDLGIGNQFDLDNIDPLEVLKYAATEEGYATIYSTLFESSDTSIRYNEEIYDTYAFDPNYEVPNAVLTHEVTQEQLEQIMSYDNSHNYYNLISNNCSSIATAAWNLAFDDSLSPEGEGFYALVDTPMVLKANILSREGAKEDVLLWGVSVD